MNTYIYILFHSSTFYCRYNLSFYIRKSSTCYLIMYTYVLQLIELFGGRNQQPSNSIEATRSASSTTSHSGSNSSRNNQGKPSRNMGNISHNSGSLSPPNQLPPPPPITTNPMPINRYQENLHSSTATSR